MLKKYFVFVLICLLLAKNVSGRHIAGGDFSTRWISGNNFELNLILYRDCSNIQGSYFDTEIIIGIFDKVTNLSIDTIHMTLGVVIPLQLTGSACAPPPSVCMESGTYSRIITLPNNPNGYYLIWERCCRNAGTINIQDPDQQGMAFYQEIADPALQNSSPVFNGAPTPYGCVGQLFRLSFDATDADGDSLVYYFSTPINGGHTSNLSPNPYSAIGPGAGNLAPLAAPYPPTSWVTGYGVSNVLGATQAMIMNQQTGFAEGVPDNVGLYALAVDIFEYRNGVQIGLVRREIQFTAIACNSNNTPNVSANILNLDYEINASDTLCFDVTAFDNDGDSLFLKHTGEVFEATASTSISAPYAYSVDTLGLDSITTFFCWKTGCGQERDSAYKVFYEISDNGCPLPKFVVGKFRIKVNPTPVSKKQNLLCINILNNQTVSITKAEDTTINLKYFKDFVLFRSTNGSAFNAIQNITDPTTIFFIDSTANDLLNNVYCYSIGVRNVCDNAPENSDTLCSDQAFNINKNYVETVSVQARNNVIVKWEKFDDGPNVEYSIQRRDNNPNSSWLEVAKLTNYSVFEWVDNSLTTDYVSYCYQIINKNVCDQFSEPSDEACTILLKGKEDVFSNKLNWNPYINWKGSVANYTTARSLINRNTPYINLLTIPGADTTAVDNDLALDGGVFGYRVVAREDNGGPGESYSNEIELTQPPFAYLPNAFSPNDDARNEVWGVETSFVETFKLSLFNRWGQLIFQANSVNDKWDGKYNGIEVPQGVYFYKMRYTGYGVYEEYEKLGSVTVVR
jgi:gliding motility-associated-like protein